MFGILDASWTSRIPYVRDHLGLTDFELALALAGPSVGLMAASWLTPRLVRRYGSPRVARASALAGAVLLIPPGVAGSVPALFGSLALWGLCLGGVDITMNEQAAALERNAGRSRMSGLHATYSISVLAFAPLGSLAAALHVDPAPHFVLAALLVALIVRTGFGALYDEQVEPEPDAVHATSARGRRTLLAVSTVCFVGFLSEGAVMNWTGVLVHHNDGASLAVAPLALSTLR